MSTLDDSYDPAHEADIRELMREQLESNISAEEANEEHDKYHEDEWYGAEDGSVSVDNGY